MEGMDGCTLGRMHSTALPQLFKHVDSPQLHTGVSVLSCIVEGRETRATECGEILPHVPSSHPSMVRDRATPYGVPRRTSASRGGFSPKLLQKEVSYLTLYMLSQAAPQCSRTSSTKLAREPEQAAPPAPGEQQAIIYNPPLVLQRLIYSYLIYSPFYCEVHDAT